MTETTSDTDTSVTTPPDDGQQPPDDDARTGDDGGTDWKAEARKWEQRAKANTAAADQLQEIEDAKRSETDKLQEKATTAEQRADAAEAARLRLEVALDKAPAGMPLTQVRKLADRLRGADADELQADADELFGQFATDDTSPPGGGAGRRLPTPAVTGGASGGKTAEPSIADVADAVEKRRR